MKTIFVVDDSDTNLSMAETALEDQYRVMTMPSAQTMFMFLDKIVPDLILLDIEMPDMDGIETLKRLKAESRWENIPVMFLTGRTDSNVEALGFELGAVDFVTKPFSAHVLINRIKTHLHINEEIRIRTAQLTRLQNSIVSVLADMVENRDKNTGGHIERTSIYIKLLINEMKAKGVYEEELKRWDFEKVISSARMHDLGKISISDVLVNKPAKFNNDEYSLMKTHAMEGERIIDQIISKTGGDEFLQNAKLFAGYHHERWDGLGYPRGLKGKEIPLQGRIMAVVDAYDALVSERPYKKAFPVEEAEKTILENSGTYYDPKIVEVFYSIKDQFRAVKESIHEKDF